MANVIKHKRGSGSDPVASDLVVGEVAIRTDVGKLFTKMDNGSVAEIAGGGSDIAINTLSSSSATGGGSATFNGSAYRFTLSAPPSVSAQQLLVSINGVIQKPVAGTGQPSEGFSVDGTDIILGDAPATGSDFFILTFKSLGVSEPADNSVTSAKIVDGTIVNADINASAAIAKTKIETFVNNNGTTRLITGTNNVNELDAESNLTVNGSTITFAESTLTVSKGTLATVSAKETAGNKEIALRANTTGGVLRTIGSYPLIFEIAQAEKMRLDTSGNVGLGTSSPTFSGFGSNTGGIEISDVGSGANALLVQTGSNEFFFANTSNANYIYGADNAPLIISTNGSERMRIDSSGNVGINDTSPRAELSVAAVSGNAPHIDIGQAASNNFKLGYDSGHCILGAAASAGDFIFKNNVNSDGHPGGSGTELMRIDSSGDTEINSANDKGLFVKTDGNNAAVRLRATGGSDSGGFRLNHNAPNSLLLFDRISSNGVFASTLMALDSSGKLGIGTTSPSSNLHSYHASENEAARFESGDEYVHVVFKDSTTTSEPYIGARGNNLRAITGGAERTRIDNNGHVLFTGGSSQRVAFGTTDNTKYAGFGRHNGAAQDVGLNFFTTTNAGTTFVNHFRIDHDGGLFGTDTSIASISDSRVKTDITNYTYDLAKFKQFAPKQFNWKNPEYHGEKTNVKGFLAQDLEAIDTQWVGSSFIEKEHPDYDLVDKSKNSQDEDVGVAKTSKFGAKDAMYISVINQLIARVEALEAK